MNKFGDTPNLTRPSLCASCRNAHYVRGRKLGEEFVFCNQHHTQVVQITFPVVECSTYDDKALPPLWELEKIAWKFSPDNARKTAGFGAARKLYDPKSYKEKFGKEEDE